MRICHKSKNNNRMVAYRTETDASGKNACETRNKLHCIELICLTCANAAERCERAIILPHLDYDMIIHMYRTGDIYRESIECRRVRNEAAVWTPPARYESATERHGSKLIENKKASGSMHNAQKYEGRKASIVFGNSFLYSYFNEYNEKFIYLRCTMLCTGCYYFTLHSPLSIDLQR